MLPARPTFWCLRSGRNEDDYKPSASVLDWSYTQKNFQWNVLLLLGGGYALSEATKVSHLDDWMGNQLIGLNTLPPFVIMMLACLITSSVTEVSSNTATAAIFLPVLAKLVRYKHLFSFLSLDLKVQFFLCLFKGGDDRRQSIVSHDTCNHLLLLCILSSCWRTLQCHGSFIG